MRTRTSTRPEGGAVSLGQKLALALTTKFDDE
jgi:hypothetical protein